MQKENEKKKKFLNSYPKARRDVERLEEQLEELRANKMSLKVVNDGMPKGSGTSDLSAYAARMDELERSLIEKRYIRIQEFAKVQDAIEEMEDDQEKLLLTYRYLRGMTWERVAEKMNYSWQHVHKIHARALQNFKHAIECDTDSVV